MNGTSDIVLHPDSEEGGYTVTVPALPGVVTQGETVDQCLERAREAIAVHLGAAIRLQQITVVRSGRREHSHRKQVRDDLASPAQA